MSTELTFEQKMIQALQHSLTDFVRKGEWLKLDYNARFNIDAAWIRGLQQQVDMNVVMNIVEDKVEQKIADGIMNSMATEIVTDIKSIMSNTELREDIRATIRAKIREIAKTLS